MQPIETIEEFEELTQQIDLSDHEPIILDVDQVDDDMEAFDRDH